MTKKHPGMYESFNRCDATIPSGHRCRMSTVNHKVFQGREMHHCWGPRNFREVWMDGVLPFDSVVALKGSVACAHEDFEGTDYITDYRYNFCPDCGTDLRKGQNEKTV